MSVVSHKCPNCGSSLNFDATSGNIKCISCRSEFSEDEMQKYQKELDEGKKPDLEPVYDNSEMKWDQTQKEEVSLEGGINQYRCPSCGGQIIGDSKLAATTCPYCENPTLFTEKLSGMLKPDYVLPFKLQKEAVVSQLHKFYKGKLLLPSTFKSDNKINEVKGMYVPFWLFDADINANLVFEATRVRKWSTSDSNYTETKYYNVFRDADMSFQKIPVDASEQMDDDTMDSIEPFDYNEFKEFDGMYLAGFMADKFTVNQADAAPRANLRINNSAEIEILKTIKNFTTVKYRGGNIKTTSDGNVNYAFIPVWMLNTKYKDKIYTFAMNGQTGKIVGSLPVDKVKAVIYFVLAFLTVAGASYVIEYLIRSFLR